MLPALSKSAETIVTGKAIDLLAQAAKIKTSVRAMVTLSLYAFLITVS